MVIEATMESKTEGTTWKSIKNYIRNWCQRWPCILFGAVYRENKQWHILKFFSRQATGIARKFSQQVEQQSTPGVKYPSALAGPAQATHPLGGLIPPQPYHLWQVRSLTKSFFSFIFNSSHHEMQVVPHHQPLKKTLRWARLRYPSHVYRRRT